MVARKGILASGASIQVAGCGTRTLSFGPSADVNHLQGGCAVLQILRQVGFKLAFSTGSIFTTVS